MPVYSLNISKSIMAAILSHSEYSESNSSSIFLDKVFSKSSSAKLTIISESFSCLISSIATKGFSRFTFSSHFMTFIFSLLKNARVRFSIS